MAKQNRTYPGRLHKDMPFEEALERFSAVPPAEAQAQTPVKLVEDGSGSRFLVFSSEKGPQVQLRHAEDGFWLDQEGMAQAFGLAQPTISEHIGNIFKEGELEDNAATHRKFRLVRREGTRDVARDISHYSLEVMMSVGYRAGSVIGTRFRQWATGILIGYATKGYAIDAPRLKSPEAHDRVTEIREILQDIRSEQANVHRELESICAQCQDYDSKSKEWRAFFRNTSAMIFYASVQATPSEIIVERAHADSENMGLQTWPKAKIRKQDVTVGKHYLFEPEIGDLNHFSSLLLDFILDHANQGKMVTMAQASARIIEVIKFTGRKVLKGGGRVLRKDADAHAHAQFEIFEQRQTEQRRSRMDAIYELGPDEYSAISGAEPKKLEKK